MVERVAKSRSVESAPGVVVSVVVDILEAPASGGTFGDTAARKFMAREDREEQGQGKEISCGTASETNWSVTKDIYIMLWLEGRQIDSLTPSSSCTHRDEEREQANKKPTYNNSYVVAAAE
ncbi:MAG: hypothetical protein Q9186_005503 [Xanthomendoza sp. 1 TL-2023]